MVVGDTTTAAGKGGSTYQKILEIGERGKAQTGWGWYETREAIEKLREVFIHQDSVGFAAKAHEVASGGVADRVKKGKIVLCLRGIEVCVRPERKTREFKPIDIRIDVAVRPA